MSEWQRSDLDISPLLGDLVTWSPYWEIRENEIVMDGHFTVDALEAIVAEYKRLKGQAEGAGQ